MLYTRKGDDGKTKTYGCDQRISKSSAVAEALGVLDEINSFLGLCKIKAKEPARPSEKSRGTGEKLTLPDGSLASVAVHNVQKNLFIIQAEMAGSKISTKENKVKEIEKIIDDIEKELPPIKSFFISGGKELAVLFDIARTIARRAERRVIEVSEPAFTRAPSAAKALEGKSSGKEEKTEVGEFTKAYLNRLSSLLYALSRLTNYKFGIKEKAPDYE